jgi:hypothetical protein
MSKIIYLDTCTSDYFQGFSGEVISCPVYKESTLQDVKEGLEEDYNSNMGEEVGGFSMALDNLFSNHEENMDAPFSNALDNSVHDENDNESVYAYFGIVS